LRSPVAVVAVAVALAGCSGGARSAAPATTASSLAPTTSTSTTTTSTTTPRVAPVPVAARAWTAATLLPELVRIEAAIHDPTSSDAAVVALGADEQRHIGVLASHPEWLASLPASTTPAIAAAIRAELTGDQELSAVPGPTPTAIPPWRILAPQPAPTLLADYHAAEATTGVPWHVLAAIHLVESRMGRIQGPSSAGAQGPMQFLPSTWAEYGAGGDIWSDHDAIAAAARLLHNDGAPADLAGAVYHYNPSQHYVHAVLAYSSVMAADQRAYLAFYGWKVYVGTTSGEFLLPEGYVNN
jgi:membrane-bound lytic murein transglycosylase B